MNISPITLTSANNKNNKALATVINVLFNNTDYYLKNKTDIDDNGKSRNDHQTIEKTKSVITSFHFYSPIEMIFSLT